MDPDIILDYVKDMYNQGVYKREEIVKIFDLKQKKLKENNYDTHYLSKMS